MADSNRVAGRFGGGMATVSPALPGFQPDSLGNDPASAAPVTFTFDGPMASAGVQVVYQAPNDSMSYGPDGVLFSAKEVRATFYGSDGAVVGQTSLATSGATGSLLGGYIGGNAPQGYVPVTAPIARMEVTVPIGYRAAYWLAGAVPQGVVDYAAVAAAADASNQAARQAGIDLVAAADAAGQARGDAQALLVAVANAAKFDWQDGGTATYAASAAAGTAQSRAAYDAALAKSAPTMGNAAIRNSYANQRATLRDVAAFFASYQAPTIPAQWNAQVQFFTDLAATRGTQTPTDTVGIGPATNSGAVAVGNGLPPDHGFDTVGTSPTIDPTQATTQVDALTAAKATGPTPASQAATAAPATVDASAPWSSSAVVAVVLVAIILALLARGS